MDFVRPSRRPVRGVLEIQQPTPAACPSPPDQTSVHGQRTEAAAGRYAQTCAWRESGPASREPLV